VHGEVAKAFVLSLGFGTLSHTNALLSALMESIFFAKFDDDIGPCVVCEAGRQLLSGPKGCFERVSAYIITKKELCGSLLTVCDDGAQACVMSCPLCVENDKVYSRNAFYFAFGFIFLLDAHTGAFEAVLRKLAFMMRSLEVEFQYLSQPDTGEKLKRVLERVLEELSRFGESVVSIDSENVLALKILPRLIDPPEILDHQVPVQISSLAEYETKEWDLTIQHVIPYIDGVRHVKKIADDSMVAVTLVRRCVRQLVYFRCVKLIDIFQYSNSYQCLPTLVELAEDPIIQQRCVSFVWNRRGDPPSYIKIFHLYASLQPCIQLKDFCILHDTLGLSIDDQRFITFGVLNNLIQRVHLHPVEPVVLSRELGTISENVNIFDNSPQPLWTGEVFKTNKSRVRKSRRSPDTSSSAAHAGQLLKLLTTGENNLDAICAEMWQPSEELISHFENDRSICMIQK